MRRRAVLMRVIWTIVCAGSFLALGVPACLAADTVPKDGCWESLPFGSVRLGGETGALFDRVLTNNYLRIDLEKTFFKAFREKTSRSGTFLGLGKLADAAVYLSANSGDPEAVARKDEIVRALVESQLSDGYIGCLEPKVRMKALWDLHEVGFVLQGLVSDWEVYGNEIARAAAVRAADYVLSRWSDVPANGELTDRLSQIGLVSGMLGLYRATHDRRYLDFVLATRKVAQWSEPVSLRRGGKVEGHAYAYLAECCEQIELRRTGLAAASTLPTESVLDHLFNRGGLLVDGAAGLSECWAEDQDCEGNVGETCSTAYLMFFLDALVRAGEADPARCGDLMERIVCNALPAALSRDARRIRYYTPLNGNRKFWEGDAYCCPNNLRRVVARLPEFAYYRRKDAVLANLLVASEATVGMPFGKLAIACRTDYPRGERLTYRLTPVVPSDFAFCVRLPAWCAHPSVSVNGVPCNDGVTSGRILALHRTWKAGDTVEFVLPQSVVCVRGFRRQSGRFAVLRGPVLFSLDTRTVSSLESVHPLEAIENILIEPRRLTWEDGVIRTRCATSAGALAVDDDCPSVALRPFSDENGTLTYFRIPFGADGDLADDPLLTRKDK